MRWSILVPVLAAGTIGVAGCSGDASGPSFNGATPQLQSDVLAVTQRAAAHDWTAARDALQTLLVDLAAARSAGTVSAARAAAIQAAIASVSSDLATASVPASPSSPRPTPTVSKTPTAKVKPPGGKKHGGGGDGG